MKTVSLYHYVYMGTNVWFLQSLDRGQKINSVGGVRPNLESLLQKFDEFGFPVSRRAAWKLEEYVKGLGKDEDDAVTEEEASEIRELSTALRPTINAESWGLFAQVITERRYSSENLMNNPWALFANNAKERISDIAIVDIEEAAKCILFQRPTAAAFHLMRATESVLKSFYCHHVRRNRVALMWGPMIAGLRAKRTPPDAALLDHLDGIRRNFRNPTQHPEKVYDLTEAQDLFGICIDVINRMSAELPARL